MLTTLCSLQENSELLHINFKLNYIHDTYVNFQINLISHEMRILKSALIQGLYKRRLAIKLTGKSSSTL